MRWRNGRGETREIAAWPAGSTLDTFGWRVSVATIAQDGAFSRFPGVTRTLALIDGPGLRLTGEGIRIELKRRHAAATYRGAEAAHCELLGGVVHVLNVMVRSAAAASIAVAQGHALGVPPARFRLCYAAEGAVECGLPARPFTLQAGDALLLDDAHDAARMLDVRPRDAHAAALVCVIDAASRA